MSAHPGTMALAAWLRRRHAEIRERETDALSCLYDGKDATAHRQLMMERAELIATLDVETKPLVDALPDDIREDAAAALRRFAKGARNALRIDSVFYMSALLYPDEHQKGEPDNLERFIAFLSE